MVYKLNIPLLNKIRANSDYRRLFENFVSLAILQGLNYILPLITFPYQVRVLGVEKFGLLSFATATIGYFQILTDYGFNLSATREVAIHRENKEKLEEIFSSVMIIKAGLFILSFLLLTILVFSFEKFRSDWFVYYLAFGMVLGQVLFPVWFFQGMERMRYITFLNILAKGFFTIAIFIFVKTQEDYWKVPLLNSIGFVVAGILSLGLIKRQFKVRISKTNFIDIKKQLVIGFPLFLAIFSIPFFNQLNIIVLGIIKNNTEVAYYSLAAQIIGILIATQVPIVNTIFPHISSEFSKKKKTVFNKLKKVAIVGSLFYIIISIIIIISGKYLIELFFTNKFVYAYSLLLLMLPVPIITFLANIFGNQILLNLGNYTMYTKGLVFAGVINIIIIFPLILLFSKTGAAISRLIVEAFILFYFLIKAKPVIQQYMSKNYEDK